MFFFSDVPVVTLTATATSQIRETIVKDFCMTDCEYVIMDCDKKNIRYSVIEVVDDLRVNFGWLIERLKVKGISTERVIIFCQSRKQCTELYSLFKDELGPQSYHLTSGNTIRDDRTCLFAMYHLTTLAEQKVTVENSFREPEGIVRVLFCTSSFGMGVDVKNCNLCIHYGPPSTTDEYLQQSGRIGRDGATSHAVLLKYKRCYQRTKVDTEMKNFCQTNSCRRQVLMSSMINAHSAGIEIKHLCCDICAITCNCLCQCNKAPCECDSHCHIGITASFAENNIKESNKLEHKSKIANPTYIITAKQREIFESQLLEYRDSLLTEQEKRHLVLQSDLVTGFSISLIKDVVQSMEFLGDLPSVVQNFPFFNEKHAQKVLDILKDIDPELADGSNFSPDIDVVTDSETDSDGESSDKSYDSDTLCRPCIVLSDSD